MSLGLTVTEHYKISLYFFFGATGLGESLGVMLSDSPRRSRFCPI